MKWMALGERESVFEARRKSIELGQSRGSRPRYAVQQSTDFALRVKDVPDQKSYKGIYGMIFQLAADPQLVEAHLSPESREALVPVQETKWYIACRVDHERALIQILDLRDSNESHLSST